MTIPDLVYLVGPTAVGKTAVAIELARRMGAEILSIDSRQAYRILEIGTAKPSEVEQEAVTHHLLDLFAPTEVASAARFRRHFLEVRRAIEARGARALAVGGSGLYVDACLGRLDPLPGADPGVRARHAEFAAREGAGALHDRLAAVDPESAGRLARRDLQRVSRALEVFELTGTPLSQLQTRGRGPLELLGGPPMILLTRPGPGLYERIEMRARAMVAGGLAAEVERLIALGISPDAPGFEAIGYAGFARVAAGEIDAAEATELLIRATRRYAKRQLTWFRNRYRGIREMEIPAGQAARETAERILGLLDRGPTDVGPLP